MIVSIVIYYHCIADIQDTLNSILNTTVIDKVVLVDNGGCDWAGKLENEKIYYIKSPKNGGYGYGHNLAIRQFAQDSEFFLVCNPDINFDPRELEKFYKIASNLSAGLYSPKIIYPDGKDQFGQRLLPSPLNLFARRFLPVSIADKLDQKYLLKTYQINQPTPVPNLSGCFMLFRSKCLLELGGFDERYFMYMEDIDLSRRCAHKYGALYIPSVSIIHQHEQASYKNMGLLKAHIKSAIQYFNKWGWVIDRERKKMNGQTLALLEKDKLK
ncbi:MAG: glycosyltransferase [Psychrobacter sp.]|nr:glycosyltransferase [Psychrobacter sp.]